VVSCANSALMKIINSAAVFDDHVALMGEYPCVF